MRRVSNRVTLAVLLGLLVLGTVFMVYFIARTLTIQAARARESRQTAWVEQVKKNIAVLLPDARLYNVPSLSNVVSFSEVSVGPWDETPLIPVCWTYGIYYDPAAGCIRIDKSVAPAFTFSFSSDAFFGAHTLSWESAPVGRKHITIEDAYIKYLVLDDTSITFHTAQPYFTEQQEDAHFIYIRFIDPHAVYKMIVLIDPGHGGDDYGAYVSGNAEKRFNLDIALRLMALLEDDPDIFAVMTHPDDTYVTLDYRYEMANWLADYFISIHNNVSEQSSRMRGVTTYYNTHPQDRPISSETLAQIIQEELFAHLNTYDQGIIFNDGYRVLKYTQIPAVIAEVAFMTNPEDLEALRTPAFRQQAAQGFYQAIKRLPFPE